MNSMEKGPAYDNVKQEDFDFSQGSIDLETPMSETEDEKRKRLTASIHRKRFSSPVEELTPEEEILAQEIDAEEFADDQYRH